jgi:hypothetical protein
MQKLPTVTLPAAAGGRYFTLRALDAVGRRIANLIANPPQVSNRPTSGIMKV